MIHRSYCKFHLGDNLAHLHFLRALAQAHPERSFEHAVFACHLKQLAEAVEDLPNVALLDLETIREPWDAWGWNAWKNAGEFWASHHLRNDYSGFYLDWFRVLAQEMKLENPFNQPEDLLFDYPALSPDESSKFDFLVVNSRPCSGQFMAYDDVNYLDGLILELALAGHRVAYTQPLQYLGQDGELMKAGMNGSVRLLCTVDAGLSITGIGKLSIQCRHHIMVSTGPSWPTFNVWNDERRSRSDAPYPVRHRIVLLEKERLNLPGITQMYSREEVFDFARQEKWL